MSGKVKQTTFYTHHNNIRLLQGGNEYFDLLKEKISQASRSVHIQMYYFAGDETGSEIIAAITAAAARGIQVFVIVDGYASQNLPGQQIEEMKKAGIHFRFFEPLLKSYRFYFGRRLHEKVVVIDGWQAFVGGINIADKYNNIDGDPPWLDFAIYLEGEAANRLYHHCFAFWPSSTETSDQLLTATQNLKDLETFDGEDCSVQISQNDWVKGKHEIWKTYFNLFSRAQKEITIIGSYFIPGSVLRRQLKKAAKKGVRVRVILAGPSDVKLAKYAERYLYDWMARNHIEIYEYQPTVLHAKMAVVDDHWVTIGSFNVNNISSYASVELNLTVRNKPFATSVRQRMDAIINNYCKRIQPLNNFFSFNLIKRFLQKSAYETVRLILNLSTFYFKEE